MEELVERTRNRVPHIQFTDSITFITWRLAFTLPAQLRNIFTYEAEFHLDKINESEASSRAYQRFLDYDEALANHKVPGYSLCDPEISALIKNTLQFANGSSYELHAYCIMSNHVHVLLQALPINQPIHTISSIVKSIKGFTAKGINQIQKTKGQVWEHMYFDRNIRDLDDYARVCEYIMNNPVKAGLVDEASDWKDSFYQPDLI